MRVEHANFTCRTCGTAVTLCVVTVPMQTNTAPVLGAHAGVGHTAVLAGSCWLVRCGTERALVPHDLHVDASKRLVEQGRGGAASASPGGSAKRAG